MPSNFPIIPLFLPGLLSLLFFFDHSCGIVKGAETGREKAFRRASDSDTRCSFANHCCCFANRCCCFANRVRPPRFAVDSGFVLHLRPKRLWHGLGGAAVAYGRPGRSYEQNGKTVSLLLSLPNPHLKWGWSQRLYSYDLTTACISLSRNTRRSV